MRNCKDVFKREQRKSYEMMSIALAVYQLIDDKEVTLLVSDGLCEMTGKDREYLIQHFNMDMFGNVHPDDVEMLTKLGNRFAREEGAYNVTYRTRLYGSDEYRLVHTVGKFQTVTEGNRVAFFVYSDVSQILLKEKEKGRETEAEKMEALEANEHLKVAVLKERKKVEAILMQTVLAVTKALDAKDVYTCQHSERVAIYASEIARKLNWSQNRVNDIHSISMVHDVGKMGIPDSILMKPSSLTKEEYEMIKEHVVIGSNILKDFTAIKNIYEGILYHHERYDAMYSTRSYRKKQSVEFIIKELTEGKGKQFDPALVDIMLELIKLGLLESEHDKQEELVQGQR